MRLLIAVAALALTASPAVSQTTTFRDDRGFVTGRAEQRGNTLTFRDDRGFVTGRATRQGNEWVMRDERGFVTSRSRGSVPPPPPSHRR